MLKVKYLKNEYKNYKSIFKYSLQCNFSWNFFVIADPKKESPNKKDISPNYKTYLIKVMNNYIAFHEINTYNIIIHDAYITCIYCIVIRGICRKRHKYSTYIDIYMVHVLFKYKFCLIITNFWHNHICGECYNKARPCQFQIIKISRLEKF